MLNINDINNTFGNAKNIDRFEFKHFDANHTYTFNAGNLVSNYIVTNSLGTYGYDNGTKYVGRYIYFDFDLNSDYDGCVINFYFKYGCGFNFKCVNGWKIMMNGTSINEIVNGDYEYKISAIMGSDVNSSSKGHGLTLVKLILDVTRKRIYIANVDGCVVYSKSWST